MKENSELLYKYNTDRDSFRRRQARLGLCSCPWQHQWRCTMDCLTCRYHTPDTRFVPWDDAYSPTRTVLRPTEALALHRIELTDAQARVQQLSPLDQRIYALHTQGYSRAEIAALTGCSEATVKGRLSRIRKKLADR